MTEALRSIARRLSHAPWALVDAAVGWLGCWQLLAWVAVFGGLSFDVLTRLGGLALAGLALPLVTRPWESLPAEEGPLEEAGPPAEPPVRLLVALLGAAVVAGALCRQEVLSVGWTALVAAPLALAWSAPRRWPRHEPDLAAGPLDLASLVAVGAAASLLTTWLCRPDVDDAYYLNEVIQTLRYPDRAVLSFDGVHGVPGAPLQQVAHRPQTYELWVAWLARVGGIPPRTAYWLAVPGVVAALAPLAWWSLARLLSRRLAWLAIALTFCALVVWGDGTQTIGRFGFVRLYQGKSVFVTAWVPIVAHAAWRFSSAPTPRTWLRLVLAELAASAFTSTALVVAPIAAGLALVGGLRPDRRGARALAAGLAASAPLVLALGLSYLESRAAGGLASDGFRQRDTTSLGWARSGLVLAAIAATPWLARLRGASAWAGRLVGVADLLLLSGLVAGLLGEVVANLLNWRVFWAVPYGPLLGLGGASALAAGWDAIRSRAPAPPARVVVGLGMALAFLVAGPFATEHDEIAWRFAEEKVNPRTERVADVVQEVTAEGEVVAAASGVAQALAMRAEPPILVGVWERYLQNLTRFWGPEETRHRNAVVLYTRGVEPRVPAEALDALCVSVLVRAPKNAEKGNSRVALPKAGFTLARTVERHELWLRPRDRLPAACPRGAP